MVKKYMKFVKVITTVILILLGIFMIYTEQGDNMKKHFKDEKIRQNVSENSIDFDSLQKLNKDIIAWIKVPGTKVNYPVVKTEDNNFYLNHDIDRSDSQFGAVFFDQRYYNRDIFKMDNIIIYGHNMGHWNSTMFGTLMKFKEKDFGEKHNEIYLYKRNREIIYNIVSVIRTTVIDDWYDFTQYGQKNTFKGMIQYIRERSIYFFDIPKKHTNQFITLSTCDYDGVYKILVIGVEKR